MCQNNLQKCPECEKGICYLHKVDAIEECKSTNEITEGGVLCVMIGDILKLIE
jgi:hypothetical protein